MVLDSDISPSDLGGEVEEKFEEIRGKQHNCKCETGQYLITGSEIHGKPRENELTAADGQDWFIAMVCPDCEHGIQYKHWDTQIGME